MRNGRTVDPVVAGSSPVVLADHKPFCQAWKRLPAGGRQCGRKLLFPAVAYRRTEVPAVSRRKPIPSYRRHRPSGQAVVTLSSPAGERRDYYLGPYRSDSSKAEYNRLIAEWLASGKCIPHAGPAPADLTVNEMLVRFWSHVESYYRHADGNPTAEVDNFRLSLRPLRRLYGHTIAREFGPLSLEA